MFNDRDFIFDNFEEEEKDALLNNNKKSVVSTVKPTVETTEVKSVSPTDRIFPSVDESKLTDEQWSRYCAVLHNGINKILHDLAYDEDDDYLPF